MKHSLYYKFILGYLVFGLLGFASIATLSAQLMNKNQVKNQAEAMYDEANLIASAYSSVVNQGERSKGGIWIPSTRSFRPWPSLCGRRSGW